MFQLVYVSSATAPFSREELKEILLNSRDTNNQMDVTGLLLYNDGNIIQVLEGEEAAVREIFDRIAKDPRHHDVTVLVEVPITERSFADWSMGYRDLSDPALAPPAGIQ